MVASLVTMERPHGAVTWSGWRLAIDLFSDGDTGGSVALTDRSDSEPSSAEASARILKDARNGDRDAFVTLMDHHDRRLRSLAYRLLDDRDAMAEAMQDVYVKAFRALPSFQGRSSVGTWLYRITYTTCLDRLKKRRSRAVYDDAEPSRLDLVADPADAVSARIDLAAALRALSSEQRAAVLMVDRDGFDYREAAEALDIPMGTLASRLSAARAALRLALQDEEVRS